MKEVSRQEWADWKHNKVTKEFLERVFQKREQLKEGLAEGQAESEKDVNNIIGQCQAIKDTIDYAVFSFEILDEEVEDAV